MERVQRDLARTCLNKALDSAAFAGSARGRQLLCYLVEAEIEGRSETLKGYTIAIEALGQPEDFDPSTNSLVRTQMRNLRELLRRYYEDEDAGEPVRFELRKGETRVRIAVRERARTEERKEERARLTALHPLLTLFDGPVAAHPWLFTSQVYRASLVATLVQIGAPLMFWSEAGDYPVLVVALLVSPIAYTPAALMLSLMMERMPYGRSPVANVALAAVGVAVVYWLVILGVRWLGAWPVEGSRDLMLSFLGALVICVGTFVTIAYTYQRARER